jgi:hypothetical protein
MLSNYEKLLNTAECSSSELSFGGEMDCGRWDDAPNPERAALFPTPIAHNLIGHGVHTATHPDLQNPPMKGCRRRGCNILATISLSLTLPITKVCSRGVRGWLLFIKTELCFARVVQLTIGRSIALVMSVVYLVESGHPGFAQQIQHASPLCLRSQHICSKKNFLSPRSSFDSSI